LRLFNQENLQKTTLTTELRKQLTVLSDELIADIYRNTDELTEIAKKAELVLSKHGVTTSSALEFFKNAKQELAIEAGANHELHMQNNEAILASKDHDANLSSTRKLFNVSENQSLPKEKEAQSKFIRSP
jgi:hypothetical protein